MPAKNSIKTDVEDSFYHIYNRGVEKRIIFQDEQDYKVFLGYLKEYLSPPPDPSTIKQEFILQGMSFQGVPHLQNNFFNKIDLVCYCLMPNHFHLLIKQLEKGSMQSFMRSIATKYSMYFNKKYDRVGPLYQGIYKAILIVNEKYLLHLSRYIHLNPLEYCSCKNLSKAYSSYGDYLGQRNTVWLKPEIIKSYFSKNNQSTTSYKNFVEGGVGDEEMLKGFILE
jgi:putative transposase